MMYFQTRIEEVPLKLDDLHYSSVFLFVQHFWNKLQPVLVYKSIQTGAAPSSFTS